MEYDEKSRSEVCASEGWAKEKRLFHRLECFKRTKKECSSVYHKHLFLFHDVFSALLGLNFLFFVFETRECYKAQTKPRIKENSQKGH